MIFIPKEHEEYFSINLYGEVEQHLYCSEHKVDFHLIKSGNCYRTKEDAVRARDRQYTKTEIYRFYIEYCGEYKSEFDFIFNLEVNDEFANLVKEKFGCEKLRLILEVE